MVIADRGLLEQAFWNLFANSIEASGDYPPAVSIEARVSVDGGRAVIAVGDSNRGIDPAIIRGSGWSA